MIGAKTKILREWDKNRLLGLFAKQILETLPLPTPETSKINTERDLKRVKAANTNAICQN